MAVFPTVSDEGDRAAGLSPAKAPPTSACKELPCLDLKAKYEELEVVGKGVYGTVYRARDRETNELVAIKHCRIEDDYGAGVPAHIIREVSLLRDFTHQNVVQLLAIQTPGITEFNLIFEYLDTDLHRVLKQHRKDEKHMPMKTVLKYSSELLEGIHACHARLLLHRDLKPQNILIGRDGTLKIGDFGLARVFSLPIEVYTHDVITLWYRSPEILLGVQRYGPEVDLWSVGCIIAEMVTSMPIFGGDSEIGTIFKILKLLGTPTEETWPGLSALEHWKRRFPSWPPTGLLSFLVDRPELGEDGLDLLRGLLNTNPSGRPTSRRAKNHVFFKRLSPKGEDLVSAEIRSQDSLM